MNLAQEAVARFKRDIVEVEPVEESFRSLIRALALSTGERLVLKIPFTQHRLLRELHALL